MCWWLFPGPAPAASTRAGPAPWPRPLPAAGFGYSPAAGASSGTWAPTPPRRIPGPTGPPPGPSGARGFARRAPPGISAGAACGVCPFHRRAAPPLPGVPPGPQAGGTPGKRAFGGREAAHARQTSRWARTAFPQVKHRAGKNRHTSLSRQVTGRNALTGCCRTCGKPPCLPPYPYRRRRCPKSSRR